MGEVRIIGTSHISESSARKIRSEIEEFKPDIVAVELDKRRLHSLLERKDGKAAKIPLSMIRQVGVTGYVFLVVGGWLQKKLAGIVKVQPGVDMLAAIEAAKDKKITVALIDQDVLITMRNLSRAFTFREKMRLVADIFTSPFQRQKVKIRLDTVPDARTIEKLMGLMRVRYPSLYKALVQDRNDVMVARVQHLLESQYDISILVVVGAGHEEDLRKRLSTNK